MTPRKASGLSRRWGMIMAVRPQRCGTRAGASVSVMPALQHSIRQSLCSQQGEARETGSRAMLALPQGVLFWHVLCMTFKPTFRTAYVSLSDALLGFRGLMF